MPLTMAPPGAERRMPDGGAAGYVSKQTGGTDLASALRVVASGQSILDPFALRQVMARLREHAAGGSPRSARRRRKLTFTAVTAGSPPRRVRRGPCARAGSALTPPEPQVARLPRSNGWDLACGDAGPG
jgi:DNA-binding NarL/FixJ family response regulator